MRCRAWYEVQTEHATYALQLPDRTYAEWYAVGDGARLMAVVATANCACAAPEGEAYPCFLERLLATQTVASHVRESDLFSNARFVRFHLESLMAKAPRTTRVDSLVDRIDEQGGSLATSEDVAGALALAKCAPLR